MTLRFEVKNSYTGKYIVWDNQKKYHVAECENKHHAELFAKTLNEME